MMIVATEILIAILPVWISHASFRKVSSLMAVEEVGEEGFPRR